MRFAVLLMASCMAVVGHKQTVMMDVPIVGGPNMLLTAWSEVSFDHSANEVKSGTLLDVTFRIDQGDLSFLTSLRGSAKLNGQDVPLIDVTSFPRGQRIVSARIIYHGDLRPFFTEAGHTIHVNWKATTSPFYTAWPANGFMVHATVDVDVE